MTEEIPRPTVAEILEHPAYPDTLWKLTPSKSGKLAVAEGRGGPVMIDWEVHGHGPVKIVWVMGLGSTKTSWQRQTLEFGHNQGDKYSSLVFDNRGMGKSDKPLMRYSTSDMAKDAIEIFDHLGWTGERELHISGVSMGGMIAQELGYMIPDRIASLNLISTAANIENTTSFIENMINRVTMFLPKSLDKSVLDASKMLFPPTFLSASDSSSMPSPTTSPLVIFPPSGEYKKFNTNYERFAAQELHKRLNKDEFQRKGFMLQAIAAGWHFKSKEQLGEIGDKVGRERIMCLHGTTDRMIDVKLGKRLMEYLNPGTKVVKEGVGHVFMIQEELWHNEMCVGMFRKGEELSGRNWDV